jgi:hypothetical protein
MTMARPCCMRGSMNSACLQLCCRVAMAGATDLMHVPPAPAPPPPLPCPYCPVSSTAHVASALPCHELCGFPAQPSCLQLHVTVVSPHR